MDLRPLTPDFAVSPQILPEDLPAIAEAGYKSLLCNRPDGEEFGQPDFNDIAAAAEKAGLSVTWVPIISGMMRPDDVKDFATAMQNSPKPMLAYCRTGTRSTMMWTIAMHGQMPDEDLMTRTSEAGYDMRGLIGQLSAQA